MKASVGRGAMVATAVFITAVAASALPAGASTSWTVHAGSSGAQAQSQGAPPAPTGVTATCNGLLGDTVVVSWTAVTHATTYGIYKSTTSSSSGFSQLTTSNSSPWTSGGLASGSYWFRVTAYMGSNWQGAQSSSSAQRTISLILICT